MAEHQKNVPSTALKTTNTVACFIFGGLCCAAGVYTLLGGLARIWTALSSNEWPSSEGFVVRSEVKISRDFSDGGTTYSADLDYEFKVSEGYFRGTRVAIGDYGSSFSGHAEEITKRYPKGSKVTVFYDPENPSDSLLEPGFKLQALFLPAVGITFLFFGLLAWLEAILLWRQKSGEERLKGLSNGPIPPG